MEKNNCSPCQQPNGLEFSMQYVIRFCKLFKEGFFWPWKRGIGTTGTLRQKIGFNNEIKRFYDLIFLTMCTLVVRYKAYEF